MPSQLSLFMASRSTGKKGDKFRVDLNHYENKKNNSKKSIEIISHTLENKIEVETISLTKLDNLLSDAIGLLVSDIRNSWDEKELIKAYKNR